MNKYDPNIPFTDRLRNVLRLARQEAVRLGHDFVGPEHLLLGLIKEGEGVGAAAIYLLLDDFQLLRTVVEKCSRVTLRAKGWQGPILSMDSELPYTVLTKEALISSQEIAVGMDNSFCGTQHLLLSLSQQDSGVASRALYGLGLSSQLLEKNVRLLTGMPAR